MTLLQPPPIPDSHPRTRVASYSSLSVSTCWLVIIACVATVGIANWRASKTEARTQALGDVQLLISSRVAVGEVKALAGWSAIRPALTEQLTDHIKTLATDPKSKLRFVSVVGELKGSDAALAELDRWAELMIEPETKADLATLRTIYRNGPAAAVQHQRDELIRREGWFGNLALSFGLPDSDPGRHDVLQKARGAFLGAATIELSAAFAALVGFVLLILAIIFLATGRIHRYYCPASPRTSAFLESFALYLGGYVLIGLLVRWLVPHSTFLTAIISIAWIPLAMLWPLLRGVSGSELRTGYGWHLGRGFFREIGAGITGYVTGLPIIVLAAIVTLILTTRSATSTAHPIIFADTRSFWHIVEIFLLASVFAPLVEETMFRGALFGHLRQGHGWLISAALSSLVFAALHPQGWAAIPVLGSIGFVFAGIREWRGSFIASAAAHAMNNAVVTTMLIIALR
jgi:membrane protease YdiL (CAAX protease family)